MRVLVACEFSGVVREAFRRHGHDAWSCDLLPAEDSSLFHYQCDVLEILSLKWDMMIAHPPCTYLANSGVCWLYKIAGRWDEMRKGAEFFKLLLDVNIQYKCIENPIMHKYAVEIAGRRQDQVIQPWMFGHPERKATGLWLYGLPKLERTNDVREAMLKLSKRQQQRLHYLSPSPQRQRERSRTFSGIAEAMSHQWGSL
jgi:hypothetical protein